MVTVKAVESVDVHVLVDNVTDNLSSVPSFVETEFAALGRRRRGKRIELWPGGSVLPSAGAAASSFDKLRMKFFVCGRCNEEPISC